ncbi:MAG: hypothetical protein PWQ57_1727 [Desulfovibrionales bacterium]|nr:hypothetical protein [Desulfovibrionales bacterium]
MAHTILLRCSERVTKFHPGSEGKRSQRRSIMGYAAVRSYQSPQALKRKRVLQFGVSAILAAVALLVFWGVDWQWGKTSEAAPHLEERTAPEMAQAGHAAGQSDGLKISANLGPIGVSGSPEEMKQLANAAANVVGQAINEFQTGRAEELANWKKREARMAPHKAAIRQLAQEAMTAWRGGLTGWREWASGKSLEVQLKAMVAMRFELRKKRAAWTPEMQREFENVYLALDSKVGIGADLAALDAAELYGVSKWTEFIDVRRIKRVLASR